jgi:hypothetical protein
MADTRNPDLFPLINHPLSLLVVNCRFSARVDHAMVPEDSRLCLKMGECTCLHFGKTMVDDRIDPTQTRDDVDRFIDGDRFDIQPDAGY